MSGHQQARISEKFKIEKKNLCGKRLHEIQTSPSFQKRFSKKFVNEVKIHFKEDSPSGSIGKGGVFGSECPDGVRIPFQEINTNICKSAAVVECISFPTQEWLRPCSVEIVKPESTKVVTATGGEKSAHTDGLAAYKNLSAEDPLGHDAFNLLGNFVEDLDDSFLQELDELEQQVIGNNHKERDPRNCDGCGSCSHEENSGNNVERHASEDILCNTSDTIRTGTTCHDIVDPSVLTEEVKCPCTVSRELCDPAEDNLVPATSTVTSISGELLSSRISCQNAQTCLDNGDASVTHLVSQYLQSLNDKQRLAATSDVAVPLVIVAGPGSGKTATVVGRVLMLLKEGIAPSEILAMTFTTAAAAEMRERIQTIAGKNIAKELTICTFHSLCLQICRSNAGKLERTTDFLIYGTGQQRRAVIEAMRLVEAAKSNLMDDKIEGGKKRSLNELETTHTYWEKSKKWQKFITMTKASGKTSDDLRATGNELGATIFWHYNDILKACNALDYHDFVLLSIKLLNDFPEVRSQCLDSWKSIVVDEFQDTSAVQYSFLRILASHNSITVVGDEDQSIFSFNGADVSVFSSFRRDFSMHKEVRLQKNYRSTLCIVEASLSLIRNNKGRCQSLQVLTDNDTGAKISVIECHNEDAQCAFVIDKILEITNGNSLMKCGLGEIAILYRRQVTGKLFQASFRHRKIPFNVHGVAFYRKKVIKAIMALLRTSLPGCEDGTYRQAFKALYPGEKTEKKKVVDYIHKISSARKSSFLCTASDIFTAKVSGIFTRCQLGHGRKVLARLDMIEKLVLREQSLSAVIKTVANLVPEKFLVEKRAVIDDDGGKLLNEDNDLRSVLQFLLDDASDFLSAHFSHVKPIGSEYSEGKGCMYVLKSFLDHVSSREAENFRTRRAENENSVTLTTIHQSKGLEWDVVFIVKANDSEIPLLHDHSGYDGDPLTLEEERRLLYVAMTRARKKLYIAYVAVDSSWQILQPSRFLKEIPSHLLEIQDDSTLGKLQTAPLGDNLKTPDLPDMKSMTFGSIQPGKDPNVAHTLQVQDSNNDLATEPVKDETHVLEMTLGKSFLKRFNLEDRSSISHLFHFWAKKQAFQDPRRLIDKVGHVAEERLRNTKIKNKNALQTLRSLLKDDNDALSYAQYVLRWEQIPPDQRNLIMCEKQEHFQKQRAEESMGSSVATPKQIAYLRKLGCTASPTSRLHASRLIEQYKSL